MIFTTNKPLNAWGRVLHDEDLALAIVDRVLERGRLLTLDGPSMRTKHLGLDDATSPEASHQLARISGIDKPEFPEPTRPAPGNTSRCSRRTDGWLAYSSNQSGRFEVYVRPFRGPGGPWRISTGDGPTQFRYLDPAWSRTRNELFYLTTDNQIMVASYSVEGDAFRADTPRSWSDTQFMPRPRERDFDLHPDGQRFAVAPIPEALARDDKVVFIFNFFDELRRIAPAAR